MKKLIVAVLMVLMLSITAFAGPYFSLVNTGLELDPALTIGYTDTFDVQTGGFILAIDFNWLDKELLTYSSNWYFGAEASVDLGALEISAALTFAYKPTTGKIIISGPDNGAVEFAVTGTPIGFLTLWGSVKIPFGTIDLYGLLPELGIECRW